MATEYRGDGTRILCSTLFCFAKWISACTARSRPAGGTYYYLMLAMVGCGHAEMPLAGGKPISYWVASMGDPDAKLREQAVIKLGNVGNTDAAVFPALTNALGDSEPAVRREAILALMKFGPGTEEATPPLKELHRKDPDVHMHETRRQGRRKSAK